MNFLSGRGAEEPTVYGLNTKVSAPFKNSCSLIESKVKQNTKQQGSQLHVVPMARKWHGKPYPELVAANYPGGPPYALPVFYSAPGGNFTVDFH